MIKKWWILALVFVFAVTFTACGGGAENDASGSNEQQAEDTQANADLPEDISEGASDKLANSLVDWMKGGTYYMKYTMEMDAGGQMTTVKGSMACEGETYAMTSEMEIPGMGAMKSRVLVTNNTVYIIDEGSKTYAEMPVDTSQPVEGQTDYREMELIGDGTGTVNGKSLPYEEYQTDDATVKYYFDGDQVYAIESASEGAATLMIIEEASEKVPAGMLELPEGYGKQ